MHPDILQSLAAERARDMRKRSATAGFGRLARRGRRAAAAAPQPPQAGVQPALEMLPEPEPAAASGKC